MDDAFNPIFIVGHPRSGTTLLATMLNRHPELIIPPETSFYFSHRSKDVRRTLRTGSITGNVRQIVDELRLDASELEAGLRHAASLGPINRHHLFRLVLESFAKQTQKVRVGEKSPWHLRNLGTMLKAFPQAKAVTLVRDGRDVVASIRKTPFGCGTPESTHALNWNRAVRLSEKWKRKYPSRVIQLRFEDLLSGPETELRKTNEFLDLEYSPEQLNVSSGPAVKLDCETWKENAERPIDASRSCAWRKTFSPEQTVRLNAIMGKYLRQFGYPDAEVDDPKWGGQSSPRFALVNAISRRLSDSVSYRLRVATNRAPQG